MYSLIRNKKELTPDIDIMSLMFCDIETTEEEGKTSGGLYGRVRLFQLYQPHWKKALLIDCFFIPLQDVLDLIKSCSTISSWLISLVRAMLERLQCRPDGQSSLLWQRITSISPNLIIR